MLDRAPSGGWEHLAERRRATRERTAQEAMGDAEFDRLCLLVLSTGAGADLLKKLRARTIDAPDDPLASESALRVKAAQSQFVRQIEAAMERGRKAMEAKGK